MPKLLQINVTANRGSTGRIAEQIGEKALAAGWESFIAYGRDCGASKSKLIKIGSRLGVLWHAFMTRITDRHGLYSILATRRFVREINRIKPDIIHLHNIHGYYVNYKILFDYLCKANIPVLWTMHDCWPITGHCTHFEYTKCDMWREQCRDCPQKRAYPSSFLIDSSQRNHLMKKRVFSSLPFTLVAVSNWLSEVYAMSNLCYNNIKTIYNGIDVKMFYPCKTKVTNKKTILGVASSWNAQKGLNDIIKLHDILPSDRYQIVLIGLTKTQVVSLPKEIILLQRTNSIKELAEWYSSADVVLNLSYAETFGLTTVEGLACGTPSIVYKVTALPELIKDKKIGRVVEPGDLEGVVSAIEELCAEDREAMRKRCREYAVNHFDKEQNYEEYLKLYENILNNYK